MNVVSEIRLDQAVDSQVLPDATNGGIDPVQIRRLTDVCERAARGDLEARINCGGESGDFSRLCSAVNGMLDMADSFVREAAAAMRECSQDRFHRPILLRGLQGAYRQSSTTINRAGVKMQESHNQLDSTARLAMDTARHVQEIATACEELGSSNAEVSRQAAESVQLSEAAVRQGSQAHSSVQALHAAMNKIDGMLSLINKIAAQTNLLALNAAIEAARVGEHGRGFAVVADEVKELSRSSAKTADHIAQQVESMRTIAAQTVACIGNVNDSIQRVSDSASGIAASSREQFQATNEISRNIAAASENTTRISRRMKGASATAEPAPAA